MGNDRASRSIFFQQRVPLYRKDIVLFAREVLRFEPDDWQRDVFKDLASVRNVAVKSGQGVGKTGCEAVALLWFLCCFPFPRVVATAPTRQQLHDVLWSEVEKWKSRSPLLQDILKWTKTYVYMKGYEKRWFAVARVAAKPENMQGFHEENMLFIVDEASGVADPILEAILGTLTGINNKLLLCGNPTRTSGVFYDAFNVSRQLYACHTVNSEDSKRTNKENIAALKAKYGEDSNVYRVRVRGLFPKQEDDVLIGLDLVEAALKLKLEKQRNRIIKIGVDVARFGDDETIIVTNRGGTIDPLIARRGQDLMRTVGDIVREYRKVLRENEGVRTVEVIIDDTGLGGGVTDRLREVKREEGLSRMKIIPVNFASAVPKKENTDNFANISSYIWFKVRTSLKASELSLPNDAELVSQLTSRKYRMTSRGQIMVESKDDMKARGLSSPDRGDALALSCYEARTFDLAALTH